MLHKNQNFRCFYLACILSFSSAGILRGEEPIDVLKKLNIPVLNYLNNFGFSPEVCLKMYNRREGFRTWQRCLDNLDLMGDTERDKVTARLCLLLLGARKIEQQPWNAAGLRSVIGPQLMHFRKQALHNSLNSGQRTLFLRAWFIYRSSLHRKFLVPRGRFNKRSDGHETDGSSKIPRGTSNYDFTDGGNRIPSGKEFKSLPKNL